MHKIHWVIATTMEMALNKITKRLLNGILKLLNKVIHIHNCHWVTVTTMEMV